LCGVRFETAWAALEERMEGGPAGCKAGKSHYVQRLDQIDSFYCIVPFENRKEITTAAVIIDGRFGDYLHSTAFI